MKEPKNLLLTGGAGYIGSHLTWCAYEAGYRVAVLDRQATQRAAFLPAQIRLIDGDLSNKELICQILKEERIETVCHLAASVLVNESVQYPLSYYHNNLSLSLGLIECCLKYEVQQFLFSSTGSIYGDGNRSEGATPSAQPVSPYARSKWMVEQVLQDIQGTQKSTAQPMKIAILRYFNVAGADPKMRTGSTGNTHLIDIGCEWALGMRDFIEIYGDQHPTPDGTCIRDFVHVSDVAQAHIDTIDYLKRQQHHFFTADVGLGTGFSVREILHCFTQLLDRSMDIRIAPPRPGDAAQNHADIQALSRTGWEPTITQLTQIIGTALQWARSTPQRRL
ncbi:MAG: UDP-glucose 4-epimerase GalE [Gammaproteobacteria bacterium]